MKKAGCSIITPNNVAGEIRKCDKNDRKALYEAIESLGTNPGSIGRVKLRVKDLGECRIKVRGFRIRYDVSDEKKAVYILAVKPRGEAYRR